MLTDAEIDFGELCRNLWAKQTSKPITQREIEFAREITAAYQAKLLAGVELPEADGVAEVRCADGVNCEYGVVDAWSLPLVQQYAAAAAAQSRLKALDEAKQACLQKHANGNWKHDTREECADAIESLKGKQA